MDLILALDLMKGRVVHGSKGERENYRPLLFPGVLSSDPVELVSAISPRYIYIADLDRIMGSGGHDAAIQACSRRVRRSYVDRGIRSPVDYLGGENLVNIVGTETGGEDLGIYPGGFLSVDVRDGKVIPRGEDPSEILSRAGEWAFEGCIFLNLGRVGTGTGLPPDLENLRSACEKRLFYGGGVGSVEDLDRLRDAGFDGAIVATGVHRGLIPLEWVRRGSLC
ncbi:MAG TPA: HisA/HisF-related TIM barrel protein [Methanomicrobiales archaeon]|nr:HisA/HisF-related TIM barrel protein [Methanomicrobiales archaeon]